MLQGIALADLKKRNAAKLEEKRIEELKAEVKKCSFSAIQFSIEELLPYTFLRFYTIIDFTLGSLFRSTATSRPREAILP